MGTDASNADSAQNARGFATTHWSVVLAAGRRPGPEGQAALDQLCRAYWYPVYAYVRSRGSSPADAEDLTQDFFARLLEHEYLGRADPARGRFRSFLLTALKHFLTNAWRRDHRVKRGGRVTVVSLDGAAAERRFALEPTDPSSPERAFEKRWAATLLDRVLAQARGAYIAEGKEALFETLKLALWGEQERPTYAVLAQRLEMTEGAVKVAMHRLRRRHRELLRAEIAQTVARAEAVDEELAHFLQVISS